MSPENRFPVKRHKFNVTDILKPLTIGRLRNRYRPRPKANGRRRPPKPKPTPKPDKNASLHEDDHIISNVTTQNMNEMLAETSPEPSVDEGMGGERTGDGDGDSDHGHDHDKDFTCQPTTSQHSSYIRDNLELLQKKCKEFHACTQELYRAENFHRILSGDNIQLSNMCGLMYANGGGRYTTLSEQCSGNERDAIRQDIGTSLSSTMADPPKDGTKASWKKLNRCLSHNALDNEEPIDTACRLKKSSTFLCEDHDVDQVTEEFFNHEIEHLHCSCKAITAEAANANTGSSSISLPVRIGISGGVVGLLIILIVVVVVLCYRHRKVKRELQKHRMAYLPSAHAGEPSAIYQEIPGDSQLIDALRRARDQGKQHTDYNFMEQAPALPERYVKEFSGSRPNLAGLGQGDSEYLEPIPDPSKAGSRRLEAHNNDAYNSSQGSQQSGSGGVYDLARHPRPSPPTARAMQQPENETYFERIQPNRTEDVDGGYSSLGRKYIAAQKRGEGGSVENAEEREPLNRKAEAEDGNVTSSGEPKYFVLEPQKEASEREALTAAST